MSIRILWKYHKNIKNDAGELQSEKMVGKSAPNGTKREPEDSQGQPKESQREPNGSEMEPKGSQREPKRAKREPKATENALQNRCSEKVVNSMVKRDARASIFGCRFPLKRH